MHLRHRAASSRKAALLVVGVSVLLLTTVELLAERAPTRAATLPYAVGALAVFVLALPALAATQVMWALREQEARAAEREVFAASAHPTTTRLVARLAVAGCWAVLLLLGLTVPRLFTEAGMYGTADQLGTAAQTLALACYMGGMAFILWWGRDLVTAVARRRPPTDPWDAGRAERRAPRAAPDTAVTLPLALAAARAHLWEPGGAMVLVLAGTSATACGVAVLGGAPTRSGPACGVGHP
jgi:hypothetical protein